MTGLENWQPLDALGLASQIIAALVHQLGGDHEIYECQNCFDTQGQKQLQIDVSLPGGPRLTFPVTQRALVLADRPVARLRPLGEQPTLEIIAAWIRASIGASS